MDFPLEDCLYQAIVSDDLNTVIDLLEDGANPNKITSHGKTCLGIAAYTGNTTILKFLLDKVKICKAVSPPTSRKRHHKRKRDDGIFKSSSSKKIHTPTNTNRGYYVFIHEEPSPTSSEESVSLELEWDEEVVPVAESTAEDESCSSLYRWYAAVLEVSGAVLATSASMPTGPDRADTARRTPLHHAAEQGHADAVAMLIDAGCDVRATSGDGLTALHLASARGRLVAAETLLSAGASPDAVTPDHLTALHLAASRGYIAIVDLLTKCGANVEARDRSDRTALYMATEHGHQHVLKALIDAGANVNAEEIHGYTPLCEAVWSRSVSAVSSLLCAGARVTHTHRLLHHAVRDRQLELVSLLCLACPAAVNLHDESGDTPLLLATKTCQTDMAELLLKHGANVRGKDSITGVGVIHVAVDSYESSDQFEKCLQLLLEYRAELEAKSILGDTPLRRALLLQKEECAAVLICHGAPLDPEITSTAPITTSTQLLRLLAASGHIRHTDPLSLYDLARINIRKMCNNQALYRYVMELPIPKKVCESLMLKDEIYLAYSNRLS